MYREKKVDILTGEETYRDYTEQEIAEVLRAQEKAAAEVAERQAKDAARQAILEKLGLTEEEYKTLIS